MSSTRNNKNHIDQQDFKHDYDSIVKMSDNTIIVDVEWKEESDFFKKFTTYEDYTPVKTSGNTELISKM